MHPLHVSRYLVGVAAAALSASCGLFSESPDEAPSPGLERQAAAFGDQCGADKPEYPQVVYDVGRACSYSGYCKKMACSTTLPVFWYSACCYSPQCAGFLNVMKCPEALKQAEQDFQTYLTSPGLRAQEWCGGATDVKGCLRYRVKVLKDKPLAQLSKGDSADPADYCTYQQSGSVCGGREYFWTSTPSSGWFECAQYPYCSYRRTFKKICTFNSIDAYNKDTKQWHLYRCQGNENWSNVPTELQYATFGNAGGWMWETAEYKAKDPCAACPNLLPAPPVAPSTSTGGTNTGTGTGTGTGSSVSSTPTKPTVPAGCVADSLGHIGNTCSNTSPYACSTIEGSNCCGNGSYKLVNNAWEWVWNYSSCPCGSTNIAAGTKCTTSTASPGTCPTTATGTVGNWTGCSKHADCQSGICACASPTGDGATHGSQCLPNMEYFRAWCTASGC
ncbi:MAG: hypothetical protein IT371_20840 [Deltaproteobacteria bacterium]|nr:hypothetical protein [Deltaproteobacteria bacterium]